MPDLMKTPSNRRYMINFQQKEPVNKHDIWLSLNKHELDGNIVQDSEFLYDTDLVLKIFMNGKWRPIFGLPLNYEGIIDIMKKKINLVPKFKDGNLAVFKHGEDGCDQLIDGGSLIEILHKLIQEGERIPITRATPFVLGGVKAETIPSKSVYDVPIETKFKGREIEGNHENDRLCILVSEIYSALTEYMTNKVFYLPIPLMSPTKRGGAKSNPRPFNPDIVLPVYVDSNEKLQVDASSLTSIVESIITEIIGSIDIYEAGEGIDITESVISNKVADTDERGGIRAKILEPPIDSSVAFKPVEVGFLNKTNSAFQNYERLFIDAAEVVHSMAEILATQNWFIEDKGINILPDPINGTITWRLAGTYDSSNYDKYLKLDSSGNVIWSTVSGGTSYPPLAAATVAGTECVVVAPSNKQGFLRGDGEFVAISTGSSVSFNEYQFTGTKIADITIDGVRTDIYAPISTYYSGQGIYIDASNHININSTGATSGDVLSYNGSGFSWVPQTHYTAGYGIQITNNNIVNGLILNDTTTYEISSHISFNCVIQSIDNPLTGITMIRDEDPSTSMILNPYSYTEVEINPNGGTVSLNFVLERQMLFMRGNPVYVLFEVTGKPYQVRIDVANAQSKDTVINVNNAIILDDDVSCLDITNYNRFLCTMQFGLLKVEPLESTVSDNNEQ